VLTPEDLRRIDAAFYATATEDVDGEEHRYGDAAHIRAGLSAWERQVVAAFPVGGTVLVTSAGAGREVAGLQELGFDVVGYEPNPSLVAAGRRVLVDPESLQPCDFDRFPLHEGTVDAVVIGWGSYMLITSRALRVQLLAEAHEHLTPGGLLLVSYGDRSDSRYYTVVQRLGSGVRRLRGAPRLELGDTLQPNFLHRVSQQEIADDLRATGFDVVVSNREPYGHTLARRR